MAYRVESSKEIDSGYCVRLIDDLGRRASHCSHHSDQAQAEADALAVHANDHTTE